MLLISLLQNLSDRIRQFIVSQVHLYRCCVGNIQCAVLVCVSGKLLILVEFFQLSQIPLNIRHIVDVDSAVVVDISEHYFFEQLEGNVIFQRITVRKRILITADIKTTLSGMVTYLRFGQFVNA